METILLLAAKSFLIAGGALLLLQLMSKRSAADRSWIAHLALAALLLLPVAAFALPSLDVEGPAFLVGGGEETIQPVPLPSTAANLPSAEGAAAVTPAPFPAGPAISQQPAEAAAAIDWSWAYFLPVAVLLLLTVIALGRLFVLKSRATVLVEPEWLAALAHAQRRMGFKHGTALLTSDELPSPISWGVIRPVILLNSAAAQSHDEAEAIITHELAHVARLDWAKLMVSRVAVALFWFNPLVWLLAREAHQLREEAADDSVLAADIEDTDYARLLVGVARHECRGLLLGAHGVAPGRNSLSRRIKRVLDTAIERAPGGWRWASAAGFFAAGMAVPVAALNLVAPTNAASTAIATPMVPATSDAIAETAAAIEATLPDAIAETTSSAVQAALAATSAAVAHPHELPDEIVARSVAPSGAAVTTTANGMTVARSPSGATVTVYPPDRNGRRRVVARAPNGAIAESFTGDEDDGPVAGIRERRNEEIDQAIQMKAVGVTPQYLASIRAAAPYLGSISNDDVVAMKAVGVSPEYIREMVSVGLRAKDADDLIEARAVGVRPEFVRELSAAGYANLSLDQLVEMRAVGVNGAYIEKVRRAGFGRLPVSKLVEMRAVGVDPDEIRRDGG